MSLLFRIVVMKGEARVDKEVDKEGECNWERVDSFTADLFKIVSRGFESSWSWEDVVRLARVVEQTDVKEGVERVPLVVVGLIWLDAREEVTWWLSRVVVVSIPVDAREEVIRWLSHAL